MKPLAALFSLLLMGSASAAQVAVVQQPRPFGYVLGDTLTQRSLLESSGRVFEPAMLPPTERAGLWFARRSARLETASGHRWLVMDYQLINAPQALMMVNLPSVNLKSMSGGDQLVIPEWPVSVAPLTPRAAFAKGGLQELRPDHPAPLIPTAALRERALLSSSASIAVLLIWLGWWALRSARASASQPFARALREIKLGDDDREAAWVAMHRAFDRTAGRTVQLSTLPLLFEQAPHFGPRRAAIEQFFEASSRRFFSGHRAGASLRELCTSLRAIERQYER